MRARAVMPFKSTKDKDKDPSSSGKKPSIKKAKVSHTS